MLFTEPLFLFVFLPLLLFFYFVVPVRSIVYRNILLFVSSFVFYAWGEGSYVLILIFSIVVNYLMGAAIARSRSPWSRRLALVVAVGANLSLLVIFKYASFLTDNINAVLGQMGQDPIRIKRLLMPLGMSFFTFHAISYVVDVFRGTSPRRRELLHVAVFNRSSPSSSPDRSSGTATWCDQIQLRTVARSTTSPTASALRHRPGKKVLIANNVAVPADKIFGSPPASSATATPGSGSSCYTFQIYFDFSGYSDMAIGLGPDVRLPVPRELPLARTSPTRSRSSGGAGTCRSRRGSATTSTSRSAATARSPARTYVNLVTVFFLCGLWHGASWNFVIWGLFHGMFLVVERMSVSDWAHLESRRVIRHLYVLGRGDDRLGPLPDGNHGCRDELPGRHVRLGTGIEAHPAVFPRQPSVAIPGVAVVSDDIISPGTDCAVGANGEALPLSPAAHQLLGACGLLTLFLVSVRSSPPRDITRLSISDSDIIMYNMRAARIAGSKSSATLTGQPRLALGGLSARHRILPSARPALDHDDHHPSCNRKPKRAEEVCCDALPARIVACPRGMVPQGHQGLRRGPFWLPNRTHRPPCGLALFRTRRIAVAKSGLRTRRVALRRR